MKLFTFFIAILVLNGTHGLCYTSDIILQANLNSDKVELKWDAKLYKKGGSYRVEKSRNAKDWEEITTLNAKGEFGQAIEYFENDRSPFKGKSYYRIKYIAYNGDVYFSNVVPVCYQAEIQINTLFPLSASNHVALDSLNGKIAFVLLRDKVGNDFYCKAYITKINDELFAEPVEVHLPEGTYLVTASSNNLLYSRQLEIK